MWAMIPMLRVLARGNSRMRGEPAMWGGLDFLPLSGQTDGRASSPGRWVRNWPALDAGTAATGTYPPPSWFVCGSMAYRSPLPAVVGERLVRLGHLVHVVAPLHRRPDAVGGVE